MATFKVGQRVKKVANRHPVDCTWTAFVTHPIGTEGTVRDFDYIHVGEIGVAWDGEYEIVNVKDYMIAPLTPPDSWAADRVNELKRPALHLLGIKTPANV